MHVKFLENSFIYAPHEIKVVLRNALNETMLVYDSLHKRYYNVPCAFDIETSSFWDNNGVSINYEQYAKLTGAGKSPLELTQTEIENRKRLDANKRVVMYHWQFGINGRVMFGRTWDEFLLVCQTIVDVLHLTPDKCLIIYVHNLSYEFEFICKRFAWDSVFALDSRKPVYARTIDGLEFRCSYKLSNVSLAKLGEQLNRYHVEKMTGDLDYLRLRSPLTPLTPKEQKYCENDVRVVMAYIQEQIEDNKNITNLPLTNTGYVRREMRENCFNVRGYHGYIKSLKATPTEFNLWRREFAGGFTHANARYVNSVITNVDSFDFTSSYPFVMCAFPWFPIGRGTRVKINSQAQFDALLKNYACMFDVKFYGLRPRLTQDNPLSVSKCWDSTNVKANNGRVVSADYVATTLTEIDFNVIKRFYNYEYIEIGLFYMYKRGYLPRPVIETVLDYYTKKTTLKGVSGQEYFYMKSKNRLNSCYGMMVTNPVRDENIFDGGQWQPAKPPTLADAIADYNNSKTRFSAYNWGCYITSIARYNLFSGIEEFGDDYIYSDTDSIKAINADRHADYINNYNAHCAELLKQMCLYYHFDYDLTQPQTVKGVRKPLGVWDKETPKPWRRFKTLGAKRYLIEDSNGEISLTVAGLGKRAGLSYLLDTFGDAENVFNHFNDGLYIPPLHTGKNLHTYIDETRRGVIVDYKGQPYLYEELSGTHLQPTDYSLTIARAFLEYLAGYIDE